MAAPSRVCVTSARGAAVPMDDIDHVLTEIQLEPLNTETVGACFRSLDELAKKSLPEERAFSVLSAAFEAIGNHFECVDVVASCVELLDRFSDEKQYHRLIFVAVDRLRKVVDRHIDAPGIVVACLSCFNQLAHVQENRPGLMGAVAQITSAVERYPKHRSMVWNGVGCLTSLAICPENAVRLVQWVPKLRVVLGYQLDNPCCAATCVRFMVNLSACPENVMHMAEELEAVKSLFLAHQAEPAVLKPCVQFFGNLAFFSETKAASVTMEPLVRKTLVSNDVDVTVACLKFYAQLTEASREEQFLLEVPFSLLLKVANTHCDSLEATTECVFCFANLALLPVNHCHLLEALPVVLTTVIRWGFDRTVAHACLYFIRNFTAGELPDGVPSEQIDALVTVFRYLQHTWAEDFPSLIAEASVCLRALKPQHETSQSSPPLDLD